jgi:hypothetical protein
MRSTDSAVIVLMVPLTRTAQFGTSLSAQALNAVANQDVTIGLWFCRSQVSAISHLEKFQQGTDMQRAV